MIRPPTPDALRAQLREVQAAMNAPDLARLEVPDTGARWRRNQAREQAWLALDAEREWLRDALLLWPLCPSRPCPRAPSPPLAGDVLATRSAA